MTSGDTITILQPHHRRRLAKAISRDGAILPADHTKLFDFHVVPIADFAALEQLLRELADRRIYAVVRGAPADPALVTGVRRLLYPDRETNEAATLVEVPRCWVAIDIDDIPRPETVDPEDLIACGGLAIRTLPVEFAQARFLVQGTASHGLKPGMRLRLWTWLSRPTHGAELKFWFRNSPVDPAIFGGGQIILTASPVILWGAFDPLPTRFAVVAGHEMAPVPAPERLKPDEVTQRVARPPARRKRSGNIDGLLRVVANARRGTRNAIVYWAACKIVEQREINHEAATAQLIQTAISTGLPTREVEATVDSALRGGRS